MTNRADRLSNQRQNWAPVYDFVFGAVFDAGRKASIAAAERIGGRILDVGIGNRHFADRLCAQAPHRRRRLRRADAAQGARARG
jgi:hypothetical protein